MVSRTVRARSNYPPMKKDEFMALMKYPNLWHSLEMYPEELFLEQLAGFMPGHEEACVHDRNGAFHWWLRRDPSKSNLENLLRLSYVDPDAALGEDVRKYLRRADAFDGGLKQLESELSAT